MGGEIRAGHRGSATAREKNTAQDWLCQENVKPKRRVLDFYGDDQAFECS